MTDLIIVGDEAWLPEEWDAEQRRRKRERSYEASPERRDAERKYQARWRESHREERRAYNREWMRRHRQSGPRPVGALHSLACSGPTIRTGCVCGKQGTRKIRVYDKPARRAA